MIFTHNTFVKTATAGAALLLLGGSTMPSKAFFSILRQESHPDSRPVVKPPADRSNAFRSALPRAPPAGIKPPATATSADSTLAEKAAQGPLQIIISLDKQQLTLYAGGEAIAHSRVSS